GPGRLPDPGPGLARTAGLTPPVAAPSTLAAAGVRRLVSSFPRPAPVQSQLHPVSEAPVSKQPEPVPLDPSEDAPSRNPHLLQAVWHRKALVLLGLFIGLVVGTLVYLYRPPVYQSAAQVLVIKKRPDVAISGASAQAMYYDDYISTQLTLIKSEEIL